MTSVKKSVTIYTDVQSLSLERKRKQHYIDALISFHGSLFFHMAPLNLPVCDRGLLMGLDQHSADHEAYNYCCSSLRRLYYTSYYFLPGLTTYCETHGKGVRTSSQATSRQTIRKRTATTLCQVSPDFSAFAFHHFIAYFFSSLKFSPLKGRILSPLPNYGVFLSLFHSLNLIALFSSNISENPFFS